MSEFCQPSAGHAGPDQCPTRGVCRKEHFNHHDCSQCIAYLRHTYVISATCATGGGVAAGEAAGGGAARAPAPGPTAGGGARWWRLGEPWGRVAEGGSKWEPAGCVAWQWRPG